MKKCLHKLLLFLSLTITTSYAYSSAASSLVDRIVVQIRNQSYTQKEVQQFLRTHDNLVFALKKDGAPTVFRNLPWKEQLRVFVNYRIVLSIAKKTKGFRPSKKQIDEGVEKLGSGKKRNLVEFNQKKIRQQLRIWMWIQNFLLAKEKNPYLKVTSQRWFERERKVMKIRYYAEAFEEKLLKPGLTTGTRD